MEASKNKGGVSFGVSGPICENQKLRRTNYLSKVVFLKISSFGRNNAVCGGIVMYKRQNPENGFCRSFYIN